MPNLAADNNTSFGGTLINQKYSPLVNITIADGDKSFYQGLFNKRINLLKTMFPRKLILFTTAWPAVTADTPPMVVISSNRAEWLKTLFENAKAKNRAGAITGYNDTKTFDSGPIPWYSPYRSQRLVYILVHHTEYAYYKSLLTGYPSVCVVGWLIPFAKKGYGPTGFGASRFAALELVTNLGYHSAWLVDDNVVNVNGFPNRLATIEASLNDEIAGIGFSACTTNDDLAGVYRESTFTTQAFDFGAQSAGLLQQVVLWNLDFLNTEDRKLNFSPYFVASNEDVSLVNYLKAFNCAEKVIKPLSIIKMQPENDKKNPGAAELAKFKTQLLELLFEGEKSIQIQAGGAAPVSLGVFVEKTILPKSQSPGTNAHVTQSMAIEQILAVAVSKKWAPANIFNPYLGFAAPKVERRAG